MPESRPCCTKKFPTGFKLILSKILIYCPNDTIIETEKNLRLNDGNTRTMIGLALSLALGVSPLSAQEAPIPTAAPAAAETSDLLHSGAVFQVNDDAITSSEVIEKLQENMAPQLAEWSSSLDEPAFVGKTQQVVARTSMALVYNLLLFQHAKNDFAKNNDSYEEMIAAALDEQEKNIINKYGGNEAQVHLKLRESGTTMEKMLESFRRELVIASYRQTYFNPTLEITRAQLLQYYRKHLAEKYTQQSQLQFQLIDIPTDEDTEQARQLAQDAYGKLQAGEAFDDLVEQYSRGFRKKQKGLWRPLDPESLNEQYQPVAAALESVETGQATGVIESGEHFFIAKLIDRQAGGQNPFSQVQNEIRDILVNRQWLKYRKQLDDTLLKKATLGNLERFVIMTCKELYSRLKAA